MITTEALGGTRARAAGLRMVLFRDDRSDDAESTVTVARDVLRDSADPLPLTQIDVNHRPALAELYHVRTTPTILLMRDDEVVDRVVGTPTRILLQSLLDARAPEGRGPR